MVFKICTRCCMDGTAAEIIFDKQGVCNFCYSAQKALREIEVEKPNLQRRLDKIKKDGRGKKYDVILGLSGGVDSSTTLHHAVRLGLRPLCYNIDNGYNTPESDENVLKLVESLKVPFYRYTINLWHFRALQGAFLRAGVPNIEIPTDHILLASGLELAREYGCKWILSGGNVATESVMPKSWGYQPRDLVHIKDIYKKFTGKRLYGLPLCSLWQWNVYRWLYRIQTFYLLDYLDYNRKDSEKMLIEKYGFQSTGEKHEESIFTKWFQSYWLFELRGIDKRKAHYSSLINSGQMTRKEAMEKLQQSPEYPILGIEERVRQYKHHSHYDYKTDERLWNVLGIFIRQLRKPWRKLIQLGERTLA